MHLIPSNFIKSRNILKTTGFYVALLLVSGLAYFSSISAEDAKHPEAKAKTTTSALNKSADIPNSAIPQKSERPPQESVNKAQPKHPANSEPLKSASAQPKNQNTEMQAPSPEKTESDFPYVALLLLAIGIVALALMLTLSSKTKKEPPKPELIDKKPTDEPPLPEPPSSGWLMLDYSAIGKDHIKHNSPCQDSRTIKPIGQHWGVAVCCDGAGTATNSDKGSSFVAEQTAKMLAYAVEKHQWHIGNQLPGEKDWQELSVQVLYEVYKKLGSYAQEQRWDIKSLACTVIAVIYSPIGLLVTHIGDGRAAYCDEAGTWQAIITPFKGEEANQTAFITSSIWQDTDRYIESRVIAEQPYGFTLLSDGCEDFAFLTYINTAENPGEIKVEDVNRPFDGFYKPLVQHFKGLHQGQASSEALQTEWADILEKGTDKIKDEPDDKTMILGIWV